MEIVTARSENLAAMYLATLSPVSRKSVASQMRGIARMLMFEGDVSDFPWHAIDRSAALSLVEIMQIEGKAPATINHALTVVKQVIGEGYHAGVIDRLQYDGVMRVARVKGSRLNENEPPNRQQVRLAINLALSAFDLKSMRDAAVLATLVGTGIRKNEAIRCTTEDYRDDRYLRVQGKGNKEALQPLSPDARAILGDYLELIPAGPLFPAWGRNDTPMTRPLSPSGFDLVINRHLPGVTPHQLRHAYASWLSEDGHQLPVIQRLMRHSSPTLTMRYIHNSEAQLTASESLRF